jgi:DNA-binding NarL/FixJ family response regulator/Arc/MetJ-type ribon-helix-helix transcriptional regulator
VTARGEGENGYRRVTAVLTDQQYRWAQEVVLSGAMEGLTCSVSTVIRLALDELRQRHPASKKLEAALRAHIWRERIPDVESLAVSEPVPAGEVPARAPAPLRKGPRAGAARRIKVLLGVEQSMVRAGIRALLREAPDVSVVAEVGEPEAIMARVRREAPEVVVLDLAVSDDELAELIRNVSAARPAARVVLLASARERERILAGVEAGAVGWLLRESGPQGLLSGIRAVARGESPLPLAEALAVLGGRAEKPPLTARERQVLTLVARGLANKQIAARLGISEKTVKTHLGSAFQRLGVSDRTQAALWAERNGLLSVGET